MPTPFPLSEYIAIGALALSAVQFVRSTMVSREAVALKEQVQVAINLHNTEMSAKIAAINDRVLILETDRTHSQEAHRAMRESMELMTAQVQSLAGSMARVEATLQLIFKMEKRES